MLRQRETVSAASFTCAYFSCRKVKHKREAEKFYAIAEIRLTDNLKILERRLENRRKLACESAGYPYPATLYKRKEPLAKIRPPSEMTISVRVGSGRR